MIEFKSFVNSFTHTYEELVQKYKNNEIDVNQLLEYGIQLNVDSDDSYVDIDEIDSEEEMYDSESSNEDDEEVKHIDRWFYRKLLFDNVVTFQECAEHFRRHELLHYLIDIMFDAPTNEIVHGKSYEYDVDFLIDKQILSTADIKYICDRIPKELDMHCLYSYTTKKLLKHAYDNNLLDYETVKRYNKHVRSCTRASANKWMRDKKITNFFDLIKVHFNMLNASSGSQVKQYEKELIDANNLFVEMFSNNYSTLQSEILYNKCMSSTKAKETFQRLVQNNLLNTYTFDQLEKLLSKSDGTKKLKLNL